MPIKKNDFIEIEFTGKTKEGKVFDSNIKEDLKVLNSEISAKPLIFCLGQGMFLKGVEDFLINKEPGTFEISLTPEKAFGKRNSKLVQVIPMKIFAEQKLNPVPGAIFNFDNAIGKILTVSGGRVIVDFNNPLAGKDVVYRVNVLRKVEDISEQIRAFNDFLFKKDLKFEINNKKLIIQAEHDIAHFLGMFKEKYKEVFGLDLEVKEIEENKENPPKTPQ